jgi:hypothetical protein
MLPLLLAPMLMLEADGVAMLPVGGYFFAWRLVVCNATRVCASRGPFAPSANIGSANCAAPREGAYCLTRPGCCVGNNPLFLGGGVTSRHGPSIRVALPARIGADGQRPLLITQRNLASTASNRGCNETCFGACKYVAVSHGGELYTLSAVTDSACSGARACLPKSSRWMFSRC